MKTIFFLGTPQIAVPTLEIIANDPAYEVIVGVFPDRKVGRKQIPTPCPVKKKALELDLSITEIDSKEEIITAFKEIEFDLCIVIAFGMIIPKAVFKMRETATWDIINIHFSLLPQYRGASPVQAAILDGVEESGISWQRMVYKLDAGDLLAEVPYDIQGKSTGDLWESFAAETARHTPSFLNLYFDDKLEPRSQQELIDQGIRSRSKCGMFKKSDGFIDPCIDSAELIYRKYLALNIWPGIQAKIEGKDKKETIIKLTKISLEASENSFEVICADGISIYVSQAPLSGKRPMKIEELLRGFPDFYLGAKIK